MALIENLDEPQTVELEKKLIEMRNVNPALSWNFIPQVELDKAKIVENEELRRIEDKLDALDRRLDLIFGGHVLLMGAWRKMNIVSQD